MTDRDIRKTLVGALLGLTVVGLAVGLVGYVQGSPEATTERFYLASDGGAVLFEHTRHAQHTEGCVQCHHDLAGEVFSCQECHEDPDYNAELAEHSELLEFHERACDSCHDIADDSEAVGCRECHEEDLARIYHDQCTSCHLELQPERFAEASGAPRCRACHLR